MARSAAVPILGIGTSRLQYFLALLLPLAIAAAASFAAFRRAKTARIVAALVLTVGIAAGAAIARDHVWRWGTAHEVAQLVDRTGQRPTGCLFVFGTNRSSTI